MSAYWRVMALWNDLRYALRQLRNRPGVTVTILATLALCIGVNTAIFSVLDATLFRDMPFPQPDRLASVISVSLAGTVPMDDAQNGALFESVRDHAAGLDCAAYARPSGANLTAEGHPEYIQQHRVSSGYFRVLGISPQMGREFTREEDVPGPQGLAVAVLSYELWQRMFHGDPRVLGKPIDLKGEPYTVIGVMPRGFRAMAAVDIWTPLRPNRDGEGSGDNYGVIARLRPGVTWSAAGDELRALSKVLRDDPAFPREIKDFDERIMPMQQILTQGSRSQLYITWAAVLMVLVIGCVNIAGLLLAGSGSRAREIATRMALGAGRGAIIRALFLESVLLSIGGGLAGIAVGGFALDWLKQLGADRNELWRTIELDGRVLALMMGLSVLTSLLFGLAPAWHTTKLDIRSALAEGGRGNSGSRRRWTRSALVACEVALSLVLLVGAGLLVRTMQYLNGLNPGFDTRNVLVAEASLQDARYHTAAAVTQLYDRTLERVRRIPGVQSAGVALTLPYERPLNNAMHTLDGSDTEQHTIELIYATPDYFNTMRLPLIAGRGLRDTDTLKSAPVAVISQSFANRFFKGDAIGHHVTLGGAPREVVGVVGDVQQHISFLEERGPILVGPTMYVAVTQLKDGFMDMAHTWFSPKWVIRSAGRVAGLQEQVRAAISAVDPRLPVAHFRTIEDLRGLQTGEQRYMAAIFSILAGLAVLLAAIGLYGLISQAITQRRHELGIRLALGATFGQTITGAMKPGILLAIAGIAAGTMVSLGAVRLLRHLLWGVGETDPVTFVTTASILLAVAAIASLAPALRILRLDPATTLRSE
jgi:predicted permease